MARRALQRAPGPGLHNWHDYKDVCLLSGAALRLLFTLTSAPLCACRDLRVFGTHRLKFRVFRSRRGALGPLRARRIPQSPLWRERKVFRSRRGALHGSLSREPHPTEPSRSEESV